MTPAWSYHFQFHPPSLASVRMCLLYIKMPSVAVQRFVPAAQGRNNWGNGGCSLGMGSAFLEISEPGAASAGSEGGYRKRKCRRLESCQKNQGGLAEALSSAVWKSGPWKREPWKSAPSFVLSSPKPVLPSSPHPRRFIYACAQLTNKGLQAFNVLTLSFSGAP